MSERDDDRVARRLLVLGAVAGVALAGFGVVRSGGGEARRRRTRSRLVNGQPLSRESFARFTAAIAAERRSTTLDVAERRRLLERMVDEELLLQRGIALGLDRYEPTARSSIVSALIASVTADAEAGEPDEAALRAFYAENRGRFGSGPPPAVDVAFVAAAGRPEALARERAEALAQAAARGRGLRGRARRAGRRQRRGAARGSARSRHAARLPGAHRRARGVGARGGRGRRAGARQRGLLRAGAARAARRASPLPSSRCASRCAPSSCAAAARRRCATIWRACARRPRSASWIRSWPPRERAAPAARAARARGLRERRRRARALHLHLELGSGSGRLGARAGARALGGPPARAARARGRAAGGARPARGPGAGHRRLPAAPLPRSRPAGRPVRPATSPRRWRRSIPATSAAAGAFAVRARRPLVLADRRLPRGRAGATSTWRGCAAPGRPRDRARLRAGQQRLSRSSRPRPRRRPPDRAWPTTCGSGSSTSRPAPTTWSSCSRCCCSAPPSPRSRRS